MSKNNTNTYRWACGCLLHMLFNGSFCEICRDICSFYCNL